jgi:hypothetical protein
MDNKERIEELKKKLTEMAEKEGKEIVFVENEEPAEPVLPPNIDDFPVYQMTPVYSNPFFPKALTGQEKRRERRAKERELRKKKI